ncbi:hypothetical protein MTP99_012983 [Tenebrio molitor]|nr:hypothetical protein MTP99_012983 [Tenebrio molitor]
MQRKAIEPLTKKLCKICPKMNDRKTKSVWAKCGVSVCQQHSCVDLLSNKNIYTHRAVLRTVPIEISFDDVKANLVNQGLTPKQVTRMISTRSTKPLPLVLVEVPKDQ